MKTWLSFRCIGFKRSKYYKTAGGGKGKMAESVMEIDGKR